MTRGHLLLVEDEPDVARTLGDRLRADGFTVEIAPTGSDALAFWSAAPHLDVVLLDIMLPDLDGFEVCRRARRAALDTPVLMLTARVTVHDRVTGLRLGADDYLAKPFDPDELVARIEALIRRARRPRHTPPTVTFGDVEVDLAAEAVRRCGEPVALKALEFQLLRHLVLHAGRPCTRRELLRDVWGLHHDPDTRTIDVHITWLRSKLEPDRRHPRYIVTSRGVGYMFVSDDSASP